MNQIQKLANARACAESALERVGHALAHLAALGEAVATAQDGSADGAELAENYAFSAYEMHLCARQLREALNFLPGPSAAQEAALAESAVQP
mgnify:CR=1 FL=1